MGWKLKNSHTELLEATAIIKRWTFIIIKQEHPWTKYKTNLIYLGE